MPLNQNIMKKFTLFAIISMLLSLSGKAAVNADTLSMVAKESHWKTNLPNGGCLECGLNVAVPAGGNAALSKTFNAWLMESLQDVMPLNAGGGEWLLAGLEGAFLQEGLAAVPAKPKRLFSMALDVENKRVYESSTLITFHLNAVHYDAQGKRAETVKEKSFLKGDGRCLDWNEIIKKKKIQKFNAAVAQSLYSYFGVRDVENLKNKLNGGASVNLNNFPLPKEGPAFEAKGLRFIYGAGEIAPAELGRPSGFVPYQNLRGLLSSLALKQLK